jgi:3-hydroxyacyl-CoA dehydrogenase
MGAQIAAHVANAGLPVRLLDLDARTAREGLARALALKPDPLFTRDTASRIALGGFETDLARLAESDWIVEAVVERPEVKREVLAQVDEARRPGTIVSSNTSGLPIAPLAEGRSGDFRRHWLGTHFFNPPRYLHLLEIIPTAETDPAVVGTLRAFADRVLGKGVVLARDTPGFIANHVALYGVLRAIEALERGKYTVEEIDAITGPVLGRPKSATFRTLDIAGLDVLALVIATLRERLPGRQGDAFRTPPLLSRLIEAGAIGEKAGRGFYRRVKGAGGASEIQALDPTTLDYRPAAPVRLPSLEAARAIEPLPDRVRALFAGRDRVGDFLRRTLPPFLIYTARVAPDIAFSPDDVDRVLQWGFGWELGPFELVDAIGIREVLDAWLASGPDDRSVPPLLQEALDNGRNQVRGGPVPPAAPDLRILRTARTQDRAVVRRNAGASLVDLGDGVLCVEFHSKMNAIGGDSIAMLRAGVEEAERGFAALVVGNEAQHFSAGANLMLLLLEAQEGNWEEIDLMIRGFQQTTAALRSARVPVVVAPAGLTLGGGCEIVLHGDRVQAAAESYVGLPEVALGLIPAAGGTKEMLARAVEGLPPGADLLPAVQRVFETIGFAKVSTSAGDAAALGYLRPVDRVTMNRERLLSDAKALAMTRVREGYHPPQPRLIRVGGDGIRAALTLGVHLAWRAGRISDHDALIGRRLADVLSGGSFPGVVTVSEQHVLDLEREAFLSLCGERRTLERIQHTLRTGRHLRN